ncbi:uncharacterized protein TM35_000232360 [Trypanosoma theileri]|uniref:Uncharacterized protein n=1 Tax=Trypanosoma theileri TaxID=67003 RepID=A0A1X0NRC5_9TRYP|nr:uncharacterized protein TM35_000232360 [Trypanosoma theileri]ORC87265.1 hypothetical protein TM35_000232360 [Trypanosoma theileri]
MTPFLAPLSPLPPGPQDKNPVGSKIAGTGLFPKASSHRSGARSPLFFFLPFSAALRALFALFFPSGPPLSPGIPKGKKENQVRESPGPGKNAHEGEEKERAGKEGTKRGRPPVFFFLCGVWVFLLFSCLLPPFAAVRGGESLCAASMVLLGFSKGGCFAPLAVLFMVFPISPARVK